jgi:hypothetical protein
VKAKRLLQGIKAAGSNRDKTLNTRQQNHLNTKTKLNNKSHASIAPIMVIIISV